METFKILVEGIVQGVGFRPFVYRLACELNLSGYVRNLGNVVEIVLQGENGNIDSFIYRLESDKPKISKINTLKINSLKDSELYECFSIINSSDNFSGNSIIPPDLAVCDDCLNEVRDPSNRRYHYPFNACTNCGPRFTVIKNVPYDRYKTSMDEFPLCDICNKEYENPFDRRYHAESMCCDDCGPSLKLYKGLNAVDSLNPLKDSVRLLKEGNILSIKGIGGTHLVCEVDSDNVVNKLRSRLGRVSQPFAVMSRDIETVKKFANISSLEKNSLISKERPIVVVEKGENYDFADSLAPNLHNIGVMLPYSPLHYLLFEYGDADAYIMTSANIPGEPMMVKNKDILENLKDISDYSLLHNRNIINRCDDSVIRYRNNVLSYIRRSRGYTPEPYILNHTFEGNILALGPELDVTFTLVKNSLAYPSQHIGNTNKYKTYLFLNEAISNMMRITKTDKFDVIACDLHPNFQTTKLAEELSVKYNANLVKVQHHHAHSAALLNDYDIDEAIVIACDGVGYGYDGSSWGGEILYTDIKSCNRLGSLLPQKMPGGDLCTSYPVRMLTSILDNYNGISREELNDILIKNYKDCFKFGEKEISIVFKQLDNDLNVGLTSSTGRVLDAISTALGICSTRNYEGEAAMKLESAAFKANGDVEIPFNFIKYDNRYVLDTASVLGEIINLKNKGVAIKEIAYAGEKCISQGLAELAIRSADKLGVYVIGGTGGTFYNATISSIVRTYIEDNGFDFIEHKNSCAGDGSVSLGQAIIASYNS